MGRSGVASCLLLSLSALALVCCSWPAHASELAALKGESASPDWRHSSLTVLSPEERLAASKKRYNLKSVFRYYTPEALAAAQPYYIHPADRQAETAAAEDTLSDEPAAGNSNLEPSPESRNSAAAQHPATGSGTALANADDGALVQLESESSVQSTKSAAQARSQTQTKSQTKIIGAIGSMVKGAVGAVGNLLTGGRLFNKNRPETWEDCVGCRLIWYQVEQDVGGGRNVEDVQASFEHNCIDAQKTDIFYNVCEDMFDDIYAMVDDYMEAKYSVPKMCQKAKLCK